MGVTHVVLHIDRLTVRNLARAQRAKFVATFTLELTRALAETDVATRLAEQGSKPQLRASMTASSDTPRATATAAARALATELVK